MGVRVIGAVGTLVAGLLGGWDATLQVLCLAMALDFITGLLVAFHGKSIMTEGGGYSSAVSFMGLTHKIFVLILVGLAVALDRALCTLSVLRLAMSMFYTANEGLSILKNAAILELPLPLPVVLENALKQLKDRKKGKGDE